MAEEQIVKSMELLPEYQEKFLKDLLANIYSVDEDGNLTGIAAFSPLFGQPVTDEDGNPMYLMEDGTYTSDASLAQTDQYGEPVIATEGGVAAPDIIRFTDPQVKALNLADEGIGAYQPFLDRSEDIFEEGVTTLQDTTGSYDPTTYKDYYDPFVDEVIESAYKDIDEQTAQAQAGQSAQAVGAGAFGGSRSALMQAELEKAAIENKADLGARLRSQAYSGAQNQAMSAFENQQKRGQQAGQLFQGLGQSMGALGEATQGMGQKDVNALFNMGQQEQQQLQREYDVVRAGQLEEAYEPFARFSYMRDILKGVPSSGTSLSAAATPQASPLGNFFQNAGISSAGQGYGNIFGLSSGGLGSFYGGNQGGYYR